MKRLGIVGGLGPESTIDYYRRILQEWKRDSPSSSPSVIIDSLDVDLGLRLVSIVGRIREQETSTRSFWAGRS